jgi:hypothetical protein
VSKSNDITNELNLVMTNALFQLKKLVDRDIAQMPDFLSIVKTFLLGIVSTAVDLTEINLPGSAPFIYADVEAAAKLGGLRAIKNMQSAKGTVQYSVSNIALDDMTTAMNYLGQELSTALFKGLHELPLSLRKPEMLLRGVEALLTNLLNQKFGNSHRILDDFCDHVHMALTDLESRAKQLSEH